MTNPNTAAFPPVTLLRMWMRGIYAPDAEAPRTKDAARSTVNRVEYPRMNREKDVRKMDIHTVRCAPIRFESQPLI